MNKKFILLYFIIFYFITIQQNGQNLVPNYSFENATNCSSFNINNSPPWCPVGKYSALHMYQCQTDPFGTTPFQYSDPCFQSYQVPRTGTAYSVLSIYNMSSPNNYDDLTQAPSANSTLVNFYNQQQNTAIDTYAAIDNLLASGNITLANSKNAQAPINNDITQTQNSFNTLYISGINNSFDFDNLQRMANLCPNQYGNAVFQARALLQIYTYQYVEYNDSCFTDKLNARFGYGEETENSVSVSEGVMAKLYPNPNNGTFTLAYDLKKYNVAEVFIYDVTGKVVFKTDVDNLENIKQINISNLQSGIYFIQLHNEKTLLWTDKLMISK